MVARATDRGKLKKETSHESTAASTHARATRGSEEGRGGEQQHKIYMYKRNVCLLSLGHAHLHVYTRPYPRVLLQRSASEPAMQELEGTPPCRRLD